MIVIGRRQRLCTGLSIVLGAGRELGLVKGTLGAFKILARIYGGNASATLSAPGGRPSWDGVTNVPSSVGSSLLSCTAETSRDVNLLTVADGIVFEARPGGDRGFSFPAINLVVTPSATTTVTVDAWVFYDSDEYLRHAAEDLSTFPFPTLPS